MGTRLRKVVPEWPKPMASANRKPFLEYLILNLKFHNLTDIIMCLGYMSDVFVDHFQDGGKWGVNISYSIEEKALGTAGALKRAEPYIRGPFLVLNGDTYLELDYTDFQRFHKDRKAEASVVLTKAVALERYARVMLGESKRITRYEEKVAIASDLISAGNYIFNPQILSTIEKDKKVSLEYDTIPFLVKEGRKIYGYVFEGYFLDIGTPETYEEFKKYSKNLHFRTKGTVVEN